MGAQPSSVIHSLFKYLSHSDEPGPQGQASWAWRTPPGHFEDPSRTPPAPLVAQTVKNPPAAWETRVQSLGWEDPLERKWHPTPVFLPGESHGQRSLVGYSPWGRQESDTTKGLSIPRTGWLQGPVQGRGSQMSQADSPCVSSHSIARGWEGQAQNSSCGA